MFAGEGGIQDAGDDADECSHDVGHAEVDQVVAVTIVPDLPRALRS